MALFLCDCVLWAMWKLILVKSAIKGSLQHFAPWYLVSWLWWDLSSIRSLREIFLPSLYKVPPKKTIYQFVNHMVLLDRKLEQWTQNKETQEAKQIKLDEVCLHISPCSHLILWAGPLLQACSLSHLVPFLDSVKSIQSPLDTLRVGWELAFCHP